MHHHLRWCLLSLYPLAEGYIEKYDIIEDGILRPIQSMLKYGADKNEKVITDLRESSSQDFKLMLKAGRTEGTGGLGNSNHLNKPRRNHTKKKKIGRYGGEVLCYVVNRKRSFN